MTRPRPPRGATTWPRRRRNSSIRGSRSPRSRPTTGPASTPSPSSLSPLPAILSTARAGSSSSSLCASRAAMKAITQIPVKHGRTLFADARHKALFGGRGGAKSWSVATYLVVKAAESRKRIVCARQFQNSIRDSSKELIEKRIAVLELSGEFRITDQSILHLETGSEFVFVGLERNPDSIRSFEGADIFWIEEARTISKKSMEMLLPTVRAPNSEIIWTWNPEQPTDPVDDYFRGGDPPENSIVTRVDYRDNPFFAETAMPAEMLKLQRDNPARFRHIWEGAYDISFESKVFTRVAIGRPDTLINAEPRYGMDFGFSS